MQPLKSKKQTNSTIKQGKSSEKGIKASKKGQQQKKKQGFTQFPTAKLMSIKTADPFGQKKGNSFSHLYSSGAIPCKIQHGTLHMKLKWNQDVQISKLPYNPLLVTCFDGLVQQKHPYGFIAYNVCKQMIEEQNSRQKLIELLPKLVWPLKTALNSNNEQTVEKGIQILRLLSNKIGSHLNIHIKNLVTPIKKYINNKKLKDKIINTLRILEDNGGEQVGKIIKSAIPTYSNT